MLVFAAATYVNVRRGASLFGLAENTIRQPIIFGLSRNFQSDVWVECLYAGKILSLSQAMNLLTESKAVAGRGWRLKSFTRLGRTVSYSLLCGPRRLPAGLL
jgi:hypothetical protein